MKKLEIDDIKKRLDSVKNWKYENKELSKLFELKNFAEALAFTLKVGIEAEKMDHHPDLFIHSWNKVKVSISTHSEGGVTENDFKLAKNIDGIIN